MSCDVLVSLLRQGSTGSEILQILDSIALGDADSEYPASSGEPTANPIDF
jgi:hypothetical protein